MIINLISSPRTISTALMYAFAQRSELKVVDEPFYAYYLHTTKIPHPGFDEIITSQPIEVEKVVESIETLHRQFDSVFLKGMAHHLLEDFSFLVPWTNLFLIRNPAHVVASFSKVITQPTLADVGIKRQYELFTFLESKGQKPIVVDSNVLIEQPETRLPQLCEALGLKANPNMLRWDPGAIPEDGIWAKYWYENVHQSNGLTPKKTVNVELPEGLQQLAVEAMPYFEYLSSKRLF